MGVSGAGRTLCLPLCFCISCWVLWLVVDVAFQNHLPEWLNLGFSQGRGAPCCLLLPPHGQWSSSFVHSHIPHAVPSSTEHLLNGRVDFSFPGSASSTLTRTANTSYHQLSSQEHRVMHQEHRVMGSSSLTRDYSTVLMGHGEYHKDGTCPSLPSPSLHPEVLVG